MRNQPRRLPGDDATIARLAAWARAALGADPAMTSLLTSTSELARARATHISRLEAGARRPAQPSQPVPTPKRWVWLAGIGMTAAVISAAVMYPPLRDIRLEPAEAVPLVMTGSILAIVALGAVAFLPPTRNATATATMTTVAVVVAGAIAVAVGYRIAVGTSGGTAYTAAQLQLWFVFASAQLVLLAVIVLRSRRATSRAEGADGINTRGDADWRRETKRLLEYAATLADTRPQGAAGEDVRRRWEAALAETADVPADVLAEARAIGPVAWLVWAAYDGEIDVSAGDPRR